MDNPNQTKNIVDLYNFKAKVWSDLPKISCKSIIYKIIIVQYMLLQDFKNILCRKKSRKI